MVSVCEIGVVYFLVVQTAKIRILKQKMGNEGKQVGTDEADHVLRRAAVPNANYHWLTDRVLNPVMLEAGQAQQFIFYGLRPRS